MADSAWVPGAVRALERAGEAPRHRVMVRLTHWLTAISFFALLITGGEIIVSHPRFYWGENGNNLTPTLFKIPIPASRALVPTGYGEVLPDQNGWSRYLHFESAWLLVFAGAAYLLFGIATRHFARNLLPRAADLSPRTLAAVIGNHLRFRKPDPSEAWSYNPLQRLAYAIVVFLLFPLIVWTGLAMSPSFVSAFPSAVTLLGGHQSARTIHFFLSLILLLFVLIHVAMIAISGFTHRMRGMITGDPSPRERA